MLPPNLRTRTSRLVIPATPTRTYPSRPSHAKEELYQSNHHRRPRSVQDSCLIIHPTPPSDATRFASAQFSGSCYGVPPILNVQARLVPMHPAGDYPVCISNLSSIPVPCLPLFYHHRYRHRHYPLLSIPFIVSTFITIHISIHYSITYHAALPPVLSHSISSYPGFLFSLAVFIVVALLRVSLFGCYLLMILQVHSAWSLFVSIV